MQKNSFRRRPRLNTTVAGDTLKTLNQVAADANLPNPGVTLDFIVNDWVRLKRSAIEAAGAACPQPEAA